MRYIEDIKAALDGARTGSKPVVLVAPSDELVAELTTSGALDGVEHRVVGAEGLRDAIAARADSLWIVCTDERGIDLFEAIARTGMVPANRIRLPHGQWIGDALYKVGDPVTAIIDDIPETVYGGVNATIPDHLYDSIKYAIARNIAGDILNLGVALGWSMYFCALVRDRFGGSGRAVVGYDTFEGFPPSRSPFDAYVSTNERSPDIYKDATLDAVRNNLAGLQDIELVKGDVVETCREIAGRTVSVALIDLDDYTPTIAALPYVYDALSPGGIIVHDHYGWHTLGTNGECYGQRRAMDEFLDRQPMFNVSGTNVFVKT